MREQRRLTVVGETLILTPMFENGDIERSEIAIYIFEQGYIRAL